MQVKALAMTGHYEFTKEEKKKETTAEACGTIRTDTCSAAGRETAGREKAGTEAEGSGSTDCEKEPLCGKNERFFITGTYMAGCFSVSFVFLHGDCFQAVSRNAAYRKLLCISGFILALRGAGCFRHSFSVPEKSGADSDTVLSGVFIPRFHRGISDIQTV